MFCIPKNENSIRPIFNYKKLTKALPCPKLKMGNIYQVARAKNWPIDLNYIKIDFAQAFFNLNIHEKSKYVTTRAVNKKRYVFNYLPFGISIAPYVCQTMIKQILKYAIQNGIQYCWGHIDDLPFAHKSKNYLKKFYEKLANKIVLTNWKINEIKSIT